MSHILTARRSCQPVRVYDGPLLIFVPIAVLLLATDSPGLKALQTSASAFHQRVADAEQKHVAADSDLLTRAGRLERDLRDWVVLSFPKAEAAIPPLRNAGVLSAAVSKDTIEIIRPKDFPDAVLIRVNLHLPGGADSAAWLYEKKDNKLVRTVSLERTQQLTPSQIAALVISPPDKSGSHLLVALRAPVSDSGCLHPVAFQVYRVGTPTPPPLLFDDWHSADLCKSPPRATADPNSFTIELQDRDLAPGSLRAHILRYEFIAEHPHRIQPVALKPQEFAVEWLTADWREAIDWTAPTARAGLSRPHDALRQAVQPVSGEYKAANRCASANQWDIVIDFTRAGTRHFAVAETGTDQSHPGQFQMLNVGDAPACSAQ